jgi:5-methylcytosine-specific restriction endonuclease McrA
MKKSDLRMTRSLFKAEIFTKLKAAQSPEAIKPKKSNFRAPQVYRPYISIRIKRRLLAKARHECEFIDLITEKKSTSRFHLEIDHLRPLALGGNHEEPNLRILRRAHNAYETRSWGLRRPSVEGLSQNIPF